MSATKRIAGQVFVLVPDTGDVRAMVYAAKKACRVAYQLNFEPMAPLLYFLTFLSSGEYNMDVKRLAFKWLRRSDRIWLEFPEGINSDQMIDSLTYDILDENQRLSECRSVYMLQATGDEKLGFLPMPLPRQDIRELLLMNLTSGLISNCI